jgi:hypothetical protein
MKWTAASKIRDIHRACPRLGQALFFRAGEKLAKQDPFDMLKTTSEMATLASTAVADAANTLANELRGLTVANPSAPAGGSGTAASSKPVTSPQGQDRPKTTPQPDVTGASISATVPGRQWLMGKEAFEAKMPHHEGIKALWETKWKFPCSKSLYPFHDGKYEDFEPIFEFLIEVRTHKVSCSVDNPKLST